MTGIKILSLPSAGAITGAEAVPVVQGGVTSQTPLNKLTSVAPKTVASITALRALNVTGATYGTLAAVRFFWNLGDGGGLYYLDAADVTSADNGGTLIVDTAGNRWKLECPLGAVPIEAFGGGITGIATTNTAAFNAWVLAVVAVTAPNRLVFRNVGTYAFLTAPTVMTNIGTLHISGAGLNTVLTKNFSSADETEALFNANGSTTLFISNMAIGMGLNNGASTPVAGGSLIRLVAVAGAAAPDFSHIKDIYFTSYGGGNSNAGQKTITAATNANPGVFTSAAHGYSNGDKVVYMYGTGGTWYTISGKLMTIAGVTANTFTLTNTATGVPTDTSGFGAFGASSATVTLAYTYDYAISTEGTTRALGVRGVCINGCQVFGGRKGSMLIKGCITTDLGGTTTSDAGWNAAVVITGSVGTPSSYVAVSGPTVSRVDLDYSQYAHITAQVQGQYTYTANSLYNQTFGYIGGPITRVAGNNSGPNFTIMPGGQVMQWKAITGVTNAYATFTWPAAFKIAPTMYGGNPTGSAGAAPTLALNAATTTGIDVAGTNLSGGGNANIWAIGDIA